MDKEYLVKKPTANDYSLAKMYSNKVAAKIVSERDENGKPTCVVRSQLEKLRVDLGLWNEDKQKELDDLDDEIFNTTRMLTNGGKMTRQQGKDLAFKLKELRAKKFDLLRASRELDEITLEAQVENSNFDYLCSTCIIDEEGNKVYKSVEDYKEHADEPEAFAAAAKLAALLFDYNQDREKELPENKFLIKYGFVNDNLRFVDKDGNYVDSEGRKVDEDRRYVDEAGNYIDRNGNKVDKDGNLLENVTEIVD